MQNRDYLSLFFAIICYDILMQHLLTLTDEDIFENAANLPHNDWFKRSAARAVVLTESSAIYLLRMSTHGYHKLPGGGVESDESFKDAIHRELLEEIGCPASLGVPLGEIVEYRNDERMEQHSVCYLAQQSGPLIGTALEESEIAEGAETVIAKNIDEAIALLENDTPTNYGGHFIQARDLRFLRAAKAALAPR